MAKVSMIRAGIDPVERKEVMGHIIRITEEIERGTKKRIKKLQKNRIREDHKERET